jgi:hypothetical protein
VKRLRPGKFILLTRAREFDWLQLQTASFQPQSRFQWILRGTFKTSPRDFFLDELLNVAGNQDGDEERGLPRGTRKMVISLP